MAAILHFIHFDMIYTKEAFFYFFFTFFYFFTFLKYFFAAFFLLFFVVEFWLSFPVQEVGTIYQNAIQYTVYRRQEKRSFTYTAHCI
jgi:hypothetical protein